MEVNPAAVSNADLRRRIGTCPVHGGAWSYKCDECWLTMNEIDRRVKAGTMAYDPKDDPRWPRPKT